MTGCCRLHDRVSAEPEWKETGSAFIKSVTRLLERLLDYRRVMEGETNYSQKMLCTVNLLVSYNCTVIVAYNGQFSWPRENQCELFR